MDTTFRAIKATELTSGMRLKRGLYNRFTLVTRVSVGVACTMFDLDDGTHHYVRNVTALEIAV